MNAREDPGAAWLEPWCEEHSAPANHCLACVGASHDAWMHRAKAAESIVERLEDDLAVVDAEVERLREALGEITKWAEAARGHYGIEECSGPGQARTEWDEIQDGLRSAALFAREALETSSGSRDRT